MTHPRVAVVGAGPAGCAAAGVLGRAGIVVDLFERGAPGKDKPCGDVYSGQAILFMEQYGIARDEIEQLGGVPITHTDIFQHETQLWQFPAAGWVVPRAVLDQRLRDAIAPYAQIRYGATVTTLVPDSDGVLQLSWRVASGVTAVDRYDAVVIANGSGSLLSRQWELAGEPIMGAAISSYATGTMPKAAQFLVDSAYKPGYGWVFPAGNGRVNLGVCALSPTSGQQLRQLAKALTREWGATDVTSWRGGGEALWSGKGTTWHSADGVISCGDAAGLVDPASAEGITGALLSGDAAGKAISSYLNADRELQALKDYSRWVRAHFREQYRATSERILWNALCGVLPA